MEGQSTELIAIDARTQQKSTFQIHRSYVVVVANT